ncbi:hypothetical protein XAC908_650032 [Xanthomonas citri pv. citri]|nr:hypothetical protein XAC908_650032 [Xanthomonas citri pv. citri]
MGIATFMGRLAALGCDFALLVFVHRSKAAVAGATLVVVLICHCGFSFRQLGNAPLDAVVRGQHRGGGINRTWGFRQLGVSRQAGLTSDLHCRKTRCGEAILQTLDSMSTQPCTCAARS